MASDPRGDAVALPPTDTREPALISLLLPTRARPQWARGFFDSLVALTDVSDRLEIVMYLDDDDESSRGLTHEQLTIRAIVGPRQGMGANNTACSREARGELLMLANDDVVVATRGWDQALRRCHARFPDGIYLAWVNDRFKKHRLSTFPVLSRRVCEVLEEPYPLAYNGGLIDVELFDIFTRLRQLGHNRLIYLDDVVFEHLHYRTGKSPFDETYRRRGRFDDDPVFMARRAVRQRQAERLVAAILDQPLPPRLAMRDAVWPRNPIAAVTGFARAFLTDRQLPLSRRWFLFSWYCARFAVATLGPKGRRPCVHPS